MIQCQHFYNLLIENGIDFFTGVPDSLLKDFCAFVFAHTNNRKNIIAANEGNAIALAAGYHLATGKIGLVYMQNSGQGNAVNPLLSLIDKKVYNIPLLMMIGWRGEPGVKDEPQHLKQGEVTINLLETLGISYQILPKHMGEVKSVLRTAMNTLRKKREPYAFVVRKGTFETYTLKDTNETVSELSREKAIHFIVNQFDEHDIIVSTTGKISRELFEYREQLQQSHDQDFLNVGSMGHASQIALAIALSKVDKTVYCFDGDGSIIMHMGSLAIIGTKGPENFKHIVLNNGAHDSVGGQPTAGLGIDIPAIAKACGYKNAFRAITEHEVKDNLKMLKSLKGPVLLEIKVTKGARKDLGRPTIGPIDNKIAFMRNLLGG